MKKIAISQSNYIPWKGYFDLIASVDEFVLYDDMQYTRRDWRNRNQIKTPHGVQWLTIPVKVKGKFFQKIKDTEIEGNEWASNHWKTLSQYYRRASHFQEVADWLEPLYFENMPLHLSQLNRRLIEAVCAYLKIKTVISNSWDYPLLGDKTERLADICIAAGGGEYVTGQTAQAYINEAVFAQKNIKLTWFNYTNYPEYPQLWGNFIHNVTILDLLFNCGRTSSNFMRYVIS